MTDMPFPSPLPLGLCGVACLSGDATASEMWAKGIRTSMEHAEHRDLLGQGAEI